MSTGKVVLGAVAGLAVGAILGVLFAPEKGSVTRQKIVDEGHDLADGVKSKYKEFADSVTDKFKSAKNDAQEFAENGKAKYEEVKKDANNALSSYKS
jgi:gas vesicle protein